MNPPPTPLRGALPNEWRGIAHHSSDQAPLDEGSIRLSGGASVEEVAAVLAALNARRRADAGEPAGYELWRQRRLAARAAAESNPGN